MSSNLSSYLPNSIFALPGRRFPITDRPSALIALTKANQGKKGGWLSPEDYLVVTNKAKEILSQE